MHPIVSACGTATYQLAKFLTKILQRYMGITPSFVKDSKSFSDHLRLVNISEEEELVSFDISALFTSIPVPTALDVINHLFCEHIEDPEAKHKYGCCFRQNTIGLEKDEVMQLLKLVLENCVFTFQDKFFKQLHSAAMGSPCSPVVANIYMEYFENLALGPELPVPVKDWKRYVDDVFSIIPKGNRNKMLQYLNSIDPHIKFTIEQPNKEGSIPFLCNGTCIAMLILISNVNVLYFPQINTTYVLYKITLMFTNANSEYTMSKHLAFWMNQFCTDVNQHVWPSLYFPYKLS